jgi:hypothetical protein
MSNPHIDFTSDDHTDEPDDDESFPPAYKELAEPTHATPNAIRAWALIKGLPVGKRGPIPTDVALAYEQARDS